MHVCFLPRRESAILELGHRNKCSWIDRALPVPFSNQRELPERPSCWLGPHTARLRRVARSCGAGSKENEASHLDWHGGLATKGERFELGEESVNADFLCGSCSIQAALTSWFRPSALRARARVLPGPPGPDSMGAAFASPNPGPER